MSDTYSPAAPAFALLPMAPEPLSTPEPQNSASAGYTKPVGSDWSAQKREMTAKLSADRRGAISRARAAVQARDDLRPERQHQTKAERLASAASNGKRETGHNSERRSTVSSVQKAMAALAHLPSDADLGDRKTRAEAQKDFRATRDKLRQRWPSQSLAQMVETAERQEAAFLEDPVGTREALIAQYARMPREGLAEYREKEHEDGLRGSIRRARQDQADAEELSVAEAKYGRGLAAVLRQIELLDAGMIDDPHGTSARLATAYGAPAVASQVPEYEERQAQKAQKAAYERHWQESHNHVISLIEGGHIPRDADTLDEVAAIIQHPEFRFDHEDPMGSVWRAAQIAIHPGWKRTTPLRSGKNAPTRTRRDPGAMSINGAGAGAHSTRNNGKRSTRDVLRQHLS